MFQVNLYYIDLLLLLFHIVLKKSLLNPIFPLPPQKNDIQGQLSDNMENCSTSPAQTQENEPNILRATLERFNIENVQPL